MFDFLGFKKTVSEVRRQVDLLGKRIQEKRDEISHLHAAPLQATDLEALFDKVIDDRSAEYDRAFEFAVSRMSGAPGAGSRLNGINVITAGPPGVSPTLYTVESSICALLGAELKASIRHRINNMPQTEKAGPLLKDRPGLIEKAERALAALESDLVDLRGQASEAGITF